MNNKDRIMIGLIIITLIIIVISVVFISIENINAHKNNVDENYIIEPKNEVQKDEEEVNDDTDKIPESATGLLIGFDSSGGLTDVIMVARFDTINNKVKLISIPRDLVIDFRDDEFKHIKENNPNNQVLYCKLTEVYSLTGWDEQALMDVREIASIITGLDIDYMATIDVNGFSDLVDAVGGVEFYVPEDMYHYDPLQDLVINLKEGLQLLDGDKAEQLVRYRHYSMGDLQRIQVQQDFIIALANKVMEEKDVNKLTKLATECYGLIGETDFGLPEVLEYVEYIAKLDINDLLNSDNMITIPSYGELVEDIWYQRWDKEASKQAVEELLSK